MSKFTMKYNMSIQFVDNILHKKIPLDIVGIISEYMYPSKKQLFIELKEYLQNKSPSIPKFMNRKVRNYLYEIDNTNDKQNKLSIMYTMFDYLINFRYILFNENVPNNSGFIFCVKNKIQNLFDSYIINCHFYYRNICQEDIDISNTMSMYIQDKVNKTNVQISKLLKHNVKRRVCSICELPGHGNRRCPQY
jgi:hypothetical protein